MQQPDELTAVRLEKYSGVKRCQTAEHRGGGRPAALYVLHKPAMQPPLPGPDENYLCRECLGIFLMKTAITLPDGFDGTLM